MLTGMGVAVERNDVLGDVDAYLLSIFAPTTTQGCVRALVAVCDAKGEPASLALRNG